MNFTKSQQIMIADGMPPELMVDAATREAGWQGVKLRTEWKFEQPTRARAEDPETAKLRAELATMAKIKKAKSLQRLIDWKLFNNRSMPKPELKPRAAAPITQETTDMAAKKATAKKSTPKAKKAKAKPAAAGERARYDWKAAAEAAAAGKIPTKPDFSAPTHARFLPIMEQIRIAIAARDLKALKAIEINPISSTPKAMDRYRNLCAQALAQIAAA